MHLIVLKATKSANSVTVQSGKCFLNNAGIREGSTTVVAGNFIIGCICIVAELTANPPY